MTGTQRDGFLCAWRALVAVTSLRIGIHRRGGGCPEHAAVGMLSETDATRNPDADMDVDMEEHGRAVRTAPDGLSAEDPVDYGATADELEIHFNGCGPVNRVTILCDKFTGHPKGFAYIEFSDRDSVRTAMALDETLFRGRVIKVLPKRTNMPGISTTDRGGYRGGRSRARGFRTSRFNSGFQGRYRCRSSRSVLPHPYGAPPGKRPWGAPEHRDQGPKRHPCLLLITPPSEDSSPGPSGKQYP
ncbi:hypothetical protein Z043_103185 [Scleropages formosus]|uniref:RRM domain-containing protein n=1 Tax=Scleropages formosus TaxID=113540 RepID=A0A0P7XKN0_SCLFO|nr:hypothetical protein Z043_103185 [Scleropages formosus]